MFWSSGPCIKSYTSAGHCMVHFVTGLMVGDRRFPGATALGGEFTCFSRQPCCEDSVRDGDLVHSDGCILPSIVFVRRCGVICGQLFFKQVVSRNSPLLESSDSCVEIFVSTVCASGFVYCRLKMATPAPLSAPEMAPTMFSMRAPTMEKPLARMSPTLCPYLSNQVVLRMDTCEGSLESVAIIV